MRRWFRRTLVVVGLAASVYGTASLTGGWLGAPPWQQERRALTPEEWKRLADSAVVVTRGPVNLVTTPPPDEDPCDDIDFVPPATRHASWPGYAAIAVGLGLAKGGAWRRHRGPAPRHSPRCGTTATGQYHAGVRQFVPLVALVALLLLGFGGILVAGRVPMRDWPVATTIWLVGWLVGGILIGGAFAYDVGKAGGSRAHALVGGAIRGSISGMVWPLSLAWFLLAKVTRRPLMAATKGK